MASRLKLQQTLCDILGSDNVYFQPPASVKMKYDAIRYERSNIRPTFADDIPYKFDDTYSITAIYRDPDSDLPRKIAGLPMCSFDRHYTANNLNHDVFTLYW